MSSIEGPREFYDRALREFQISILKNGDSKESAAELYFASLNASRHDIKKSHENIICENLASLILKDEVPWVFKPSERRSGSRSTLGRVARTGVEMGGLPLSSLEKMFDIHELEEAMKKTEEGDESHLNKLATKVANWRPMRAPTEETSLLARQHPLERAGLFYDPMSEITPLQNVFNLLYRRGAHHKRGERKHAHEAEAVDTHMDDWESKHGKHPHNLPIYLDKWRNADGAASLTHFFNKNMGRFKERLRENNISINDEEFLHHAYVAYKQMRNEGHDPNKIIKSIFNEDGSYNEDFNDARHLLVPNKNEQLGWLSYKLGMDNMSHEDRVDCWKWILSGYKDENAPKHMGSHLKGYLNRMSTMRHAAFHQFMNNTSGRDADEMIPPPYRDIKTNRDFNTPLEDIDYRRWYDALDHNELTQKIIEAAYKENLEKDEYDDVLRDKDGQFVLPRADGTFDYDEETNTGKSPQGHQILETIQGWRDIGLLNEEDWGRLHDFVQNSHNEESYNSHLMDDVLGPYVHTRFPTKDGNMNPDLSFSFHSYLPWMKRGGKNINSTAYLEYLNSAFPGVFTRMGGSEEDKYILPPVEVPDIYKPGDEKQAQAMAERFGMGDEEDTFTETKQRMYPPSLTTWRKGGEGEDDMQLLAGMRRASGTESTREGGTILSGVDANTQVRDEYRGLFGTFNPAPQYAYSEKGLLSLNRGSHVRNIHTNVPYTTMTAANASNIIGNIRESRSPDPSGFNYGGIRR